MKHINKEINFVPDFMVKRKRQMQRYRVISTVTFIVALVCFSIYYIPNLNAFILSHKLENINTEIKALSEAKDLNNKLISLQANIENKESKFKEITKEDIDIVYLITKVKSATPVNTIMTSFTVKNRSNINISYSIENPLIVANLVNNLRGLNLFESVEMPNIPIADKKMDCTFKLKLKSGAAVREGLVIPDVVPAAVIPQVPTQNTNTANTSQSPNTGAKTQTSTGTTSKVPTKKTPAKTTPKTTTPKTTPKTTTPATTSKTTTPAKTTPKTTTPTTTSKTTTSATKPSTDSTSTATKTTTGTSTTQKTN